MILQTILEGIGLGVLLVLVCTIGIRKGAVGMVHLYSQEVQERCGTIGMAVISAALAATMMLFMES